ncbi:MAG: Hpt domain-containing protein [Aquabacterium sp.]|uniref:hybrid sensor histidine kinase/response regulator n=1 Tax=Aquabacterium sp. TaxID=1872578 RepID=UPI00271B5F2C|nr:Hpt domain-containing protein [Aquabacterium sp.]MDO9006499.1 Hpt domain-containing protein [Aquabacterium sp.]
MSDDLSALAWVQEELRKSLDAAHKALHRGLKDASSSESDMDARDPAVLRQARQQIHQGVGALELAGLPAGATLLRASEAVVQKFINRPASLTEAAVQAVERGSFALMDYIGRRLNGKNVPALALFPQYEALMALAGTTLPRPTDLWSQDWPKVALEAPLAPPESAMPRAADEATVDDFESGLLALLRRNQPRDAVALADLCASLASGSSQRHAHRESATWMLASGFLEALAGDHVPLTVHAKRVLSSLLKQLRVLVQGKETPSDRLAQELLFFCAQASGSNAKPDSVLSNVRRTFGLDQHAPVNLLESSLGRYDPAWVAQAVKRVAGAKDGWSAVAAGELLRLGGLNEQFALVSESLKRLYPDGEVLAEALSQAVNQTVQSGQSPEPSLAMEVATSLLYQEASLEDGEFDHADQKDRIHRLAARIDAVRLGQPAQPLESWMEDLYRRVSDRQTIGSVVQELRSNLSEAEKNIDQFFRDPTQPASLVNVPTQLQAMRGVLAVLGLDMAGHATVRMREDVDHLLQPDTNVQEAGDAGVFDRLASNLGALGFLIDMLNVQPNLVKALFKYDADTGVLSPLMGRERSAPIPVALPDPVEAAAQKAERDEVQTAAEAVVESVTRDEVSLSDVSDELQKLADTPMVQDQPALADTVASAQAALATAQASDDEDAQALAREQVAQVMADFAQSVSEPVGLDLPVGETFTDSGHTPLMPTPVVPAEPTGLEEDDEMRGIFLEEANEVIASAQEATEGLIANPDDVTLLTSVRRGFHTLKGSSRMVGLNDYGEAGWACEQLFNTWMASQAPASPDLLGFTAEALEYMAGWTKAIEARQAQGWHSADLVRAADTLRLEGRRVPIGGGSTFAATDVQSFAAEESSAPAEDDLSDLTLPLVDLGGEQEPSTALEDEPVTQPSAFSESHLPSIDGDLLTLELPPEEDATAVSVEATELTEPDLRLDEDALPAEPEPAIVLDLVSDEALQVQVPEVFENSQPLYLESEPSVFADDAAADPVDEPIVLEEAEAAAPEEPAKTEEPPAESDEQVKVIGPLRISIPLFNIYLNEADEQSRRLCTSLSEWALELHHPVSEDAIALAHSLAGNSATVGYAELSQLARLLEHSLMRAHALGRGEPEVAALFNEAADDIRHLLHQFAAGFLKTPNDDLMRRLEVYDHTASRRLEARSLLGELDTGEGEEGQPGSEENRSHGHLRLVHSVDESAVPDSSFDQSSHDEVVPTQPSPLGQAEIKSLDSLPEVLPAAAAPVMRKADSITGLDDRDDLEAHDAVDPDLFPIFEEEAQELLPQLASQMREWLEQPTHPAAPAACMRTLHTFKGGARLAGAMRLGELAHRLETTIEHLIGLDTITRDDVEPLEARVDALVEEFEALSQRDAQTYNAEVSKPLPPAEPVETVSRVVESLPADVVSPLAPGDLPMPVEAATADVTGAAAALPAVIDWTTLANNGRRLTVAPKRDNTQAAVQAVVRVRPQLLDRLVNHAGEVSIARTRIASQVGQIRGSLTDLTDNLGRLRQQLRDIELQADTQLNTRLEAARAASQNFDPLEFDRYTRFQELTRMMAESVNDVATVQRSLNRTLEVAEDQLAAQARLTRDLQDDLLRTRMVEFEGLSDRLYRVVRQAAKETGKQVKLDIVGGATEVDRGVLERMTGAFEHLLRNCITHGIEVPAVRQAAGKDPAGLVIVSLRQEGNEVSLEFRDDGAGLNLDRIRQKAVAMGLIQPDADVPPGELAQMIFTPGFSTADTVTELAGRGIGMDVVRSEVNAMGGRIETSTAAGQGTSFKLVLPLTTAVTKVVMLRCGDVTVAVPTHLIEMVRRAKPAEVEQAYEFGTYQFADLVLPFYWLGALLQNSPRGVAEGRSLPVIVVRSAQQRIAMHVDEVLGNHEVVVKNLGPQLSRLPGLAGMTLLASGAVSLIYNPVALATVYGDVAQAYTKAALHAVANGEETEAQQAEAVAVEALPPLVLVVDDSLTVRRVTQRLLTREGYRVVLAKDGMDALERLAEEVPVVVLSDIEMPRMDGFDLVRNIRGNDRWKQLPVVMISSRIAQKHRDYATQLGANHYLGKPYGEEELLALVARYALQREAAGVSGAA